MTLLSGQQPVTVVALGDSTTAGTPGFRSPLEDPPSGSGNVESQFAYWLEQAHREWRVLNRGINGERSDQIRARFVRDVLESGPALVIIVAGVNDVYQGRSPERVEEHLAWMYAQAGTAGIPVVAGSIIPYNTATTDQNGRMHAVNRWIEEQAALDPNLTFCNTRRAVAAPDDPDRLISSPDQLHPSPEGYRLMAEALRAVIEKVLAFRSVR
jgi:lysophospholipase L1-like esterase